MLKNEFTIGKKLVSNGQEPFVIAEIGSNHDQSIDIAKKLIDIAKEARADAVKFQLFRAEKLYPPKTEMYEIFKSIELSGKWLQPLKKHADQNDIAFICSPFDNESIDLLCDINVDALKIASSETVNFPLLSYAAKKGKPVILSTGMCDLVDILEAVNICKISGNDKVAILQCASMYPAPIEKVNVLAMRTFREVFHCPVGFSDHTLDDTSAIVAVALGASIIEKHITYDKKAKGPDHFYALEPDELRRFVRSVKDAYQSLGSSVKDLLPEERGVGRREGIYSCQDIEPGAHLTIENIKIKRPALGIRSRYVEIIKGCKVVKKIKQNSPINWDDISFNN